MHNQALSPADIADNRILGMFDPQQFRNTGHALIDLLADYLAANMAGTGKVIDWVPPQIAESDWLAPLPQQSVLDSDALLERLRHEILPGTLAIHHPHNLGHQVAAPLPLAALCDLVAALANQAMAVYETGPSATLLERQVIRWLGELIGWTKAEGVLTSGGAQANLTALLAARQHSADWDVWQQGVSQGRQLKILASEHAHYSICRAAGIMGLGANSVVKVAADAAGRMNISALQQAHQEATEQGAIVMAVVPTAGCTPSGTADPLPSIGSYCRKNNLWLHVDGAHGASALLSPKYRHALSGIEYADSVVWDGHKLLYMPAAVSAVLFQKPEHANEAFAQEASYLFQGSSHSEETYNTSYRTLECTKRMMGLKLWAAFSLYGREGMALLVERVFSTARLLGEKLEEAEDFECLMPPQTNIVCFRLRGVDQAALRSAVIEAGAFHITQVTLHGEVWLRTTIMNPLTTEQDLDELLKMLRRLAT